MARAGTADEFDAAFSTLVQQKVGAILFANDAYFHGQRQKLIALAADYRMPAIYFFGATLLWTVA